MLKIQTVVTSAFVSNTGRIPTVPLQHRFGSRVRQLRRQRGMTQVQMADYLGIDRSFLSDIERGRKSISLSYLETVAQGFHLSLSQLLVDL